MNRIRNTLLVTALLAASAAQSAPMVGLTPTGNLAFFDSETPQTIVAQVNVGGVTAGETLVGIDTRPLTGELFAIGSQGRVYLITTTGIATTLTTVPVPLSGTFFGMDFNPAVDRIRFISDNDQNLRFNQITGGLAATDTNLSPAGDKVGAAYDRNVAGTTLTTLYVIDSGTDTLATQGGIDGTPSPNGGLITNIGALGVDTSGAADLDISASGNVRALLTVGGTSGIYGINLTTGAATLIGATGVPLTDVTFVPSLPVAFTSVPSLNWTGLAAMVSILVLSGLMLTRRKA